MRLSSSPLPKGKLPSKQGHLRVQKSGCFLLGLQIIGFFHQQQKERSYGISHCCRVLDEWWSFGVQRRHARNEDNAKTCKGAQRLKMCLVLPAATATSQEWYFRVGEKERTSAPHHGPDGWQRSGVKPERCSCEPLDGCHAASGSGEGGNHAHRLHSKNRFMTRLSTEPFFLISTPG